MNTFLLIGLTLIFTACGRFSPEEGEWIVERSETFSNTCGFDEDTEEDTTSNEKDIFVLSSIKDGGYNIDLDEDMTLNCLLDNQDLTCDPFELIEEDVEMATTITQIMTHTGVFSSETELDLHVMVDLDCAGDGCPMLEMFGITIPCSAEKTMLALKKQGISIAE